jgi:hypothetical protein
MSGSSGRAWTWRHLILKSDLSATTRHVLLTLSCFMNDVGGGCYPTQEQLAEATGLSDRAVRKHLELAESAGWLKRTEHGFRGQRWRNTEYWALWPDPLDVDEGAEPRSARVEESSGTSFRKVRNQVPTTSPDPFTPLPPEGGRDDGAPDVVAPMQHVHAVLDEELYRECCRLKHNRNPSLTDGRGGWMFPALIIETARANLAKASKS